MEVWGHTRVAIQSEAGSAPSSTTTRRGGAGAEERRSNVLALLVSKSGARGSDAWAAATRVDASSLDTSSLGAPSIARVCHDSATAAATVAATGVATGVATGAATGAATVASSARYLRRSP